MNNHRRVHALARLFNEGVMGFLALVALATALGPLVFDVSPTIERALTVVEWLVVTSFATELVVQWAVAPVRRVWLRSPWRIVDALTILGPVAALLPQVSDLARGSLLLRTLRVGRAVAFATRAGSVAVRQPHATFDATAATIPVVSMICEEGDQRPCGCDWEGFLAWTREPGASWYHASNLDREHFRELAHAAGVSDEELDGALREDAHAKLREGAHHATLILQIPSIAEVGIPVVHRDRLVAIITDCGLFTATTGTFELQNGLELSPRAALPSVAFPARIVCALLALARKRNTAVAQRFDDEVRRLEALEGGRVFLSETFRLRREISTTTLDLWHLKAIVRALADGKTKLRGVDLKNDKYLDDLMAETDSLYETVDRNKEELKTLIELHINFKSFEMNSFLKLLAVVSFLGLIPSVAGGLLGMNVAGNPWPVSLGQVTFGVAMGMATALYVFAVKGWLGIDASGRGRRQCEVSGLFKDAVQRRGGWKHPRPAVELAEGCERDANGLRRRRWSTNVIALEDAEPATRLFEGEQLRIADPEQRPAQDCDQRQGILRIGERTQQHRHSLDLGRLAKGAGAAHLDRDVQCLQSRGVRRNPVALLPGLDQKIAEAAAAGSHLRSNVGRDFFRVLLVDLIPLVSVVRVNTAPKVGSPPSFGSSAAKRGACVVGAAGHLVRKTSFAQLHNRGTERKFSVSGTTHPTDGSLKRCRTML